MKFINIYFSWILLAIVLGIAAIASVHFIHAYERLAVKRLEVTVTIPPEYDQPVPEVVGVGTETDGAGAVTDAPVFRAFG